VRALLLLTCLPAFLAAQDARDIIQQAIQVNDRNDELARNYTYLERQDLQTFDGSGHLKERRLETWDITMLEGSPYRRLVARNDQPLPPADERKEEEKLRRSNQDRAHETEEQRQRRIADAQKRRDERQREPVKELLQGFDFRLSGTESLGGRDVWVIDATPHPGFKGTGEIARAMFPKIHCRFWIEKTGYHAAKIEIDTLDTVPLGLFLLRLAKGSRIAIEFAEVNNEVWLPKQVTASAAARLLLVKSMRMSMQFDFSGYKKFQAESHVVSTGEIK